MQCLRVRKSVDQALAKKVNNCLIVDKWVRNDPFIQALTNFFLSFVDLLQLVTYIEWITQDFQHRSRDAHCVFGDDHKRNFSRQISITWVFHRFALREKLEQEAEAVEDNGLVEPASRGEQALDYLC